MPSVAAVNVVANIEPSIAASSSIPTITTAVAQCIMSSVTNLATSTMADLYRMGKAPEPSSTVSTSILIATTRDVREGIADAVDRVAHVIDRSLNTAYNSQAYLSNKLKERLPLWLAGWILKFLMHLFNLVGLVSVILLMSSIAQITSYRVHRIVGLVPDELVKYAWMSPEDMNNQIDGMPYEEQRKNKVLKARTEKLNQSLMGGTLGPWAVSSAWTLLAVWLIDGYSWWGRLGIALLCSIGVMNLLPILAALLVRVICPKATDGAEWLCKKDEVVIAGAKPSAINAKPAAAPPVVQVEELGPGEYTNEGRRVRYGKRSKTRFA